MSVNQNMWEEGSFSGVKNNDLNLVRTSTHIKRWKGASDGSLTITAREDSETYSRSTTHFTLNSTVQDHANGTFSGGRFAVVSNLREASEKNVITGLSQVDTWMIPNKNREMVLPNATIFAPEGEDVSSLEGVNIRRYKGSDNAGENYKTLSKSIEDFFKENNKPIFDAQTHGWAGQSQTTVQEREALSKLLGSESMLDAVHSGSVDEHFEDTLSDGKKLKNYIKADNFSVNELPPGQQVSDLERTLNNLLGSVEGARKELYQSKVDEVMKPLKEEYNAWVDTKYPPEDIVPKAPPMPPPLPSTSVPPPIPSSIPPPLPPESLAQLQVGKEMPPPMVQPVREKLEDLAKSGKLKPSETKPVGMPPIPGAIENTKPLEEVKKPLPSKQIQSPIKKVDSQRQAQSKVKEAPKKTDSVPKPKHTEIPTTPVKTEQQAKTTPKKQQRKIEKPKPVDSAHPSGGLGSKSFQQQLKGMGIHVLDVETTGVEVGDKMFSSGRVQIDRKGNPIKGTEIESHYDVGQGGNIDRKYFRTEAEYQEALEKNLARAHSSKSFGEAQRERGSLAGNAQARIKGELTTPTQFLEGLDKDLANNPKGSIIWGHNTRFENNQFSKLDGTSSEYSSVYKRIEARNMVNSRGLFGESPKMSNKASDPMMKGLTQKATSILYEDVNESILSQNPDKLRAALGKYASANIDVVNHLQNQIEEVRLKGGKYVVGDSMHLSKAVMALGAYTGQFDPKNLMLGNKIETLAHVMLDGYKETHQALDDAKIQGKITAKLTEELDNFRADPQYKSEFLEKLNKHISSDDGKLANSTYKDSLLRELRDVKHLDDAEGFVDTYKWIDKTTKNYSVANGSTSDREAFARQFKTALNEAYQEKGATIDSVKSNMEKFITDTEVAGAAERMGAPEAARDGKSLMKKALDGKGKVLAIAGGLAAANLFIGGGEKGQDKKYNTYDELYNNQYYGSGFADWQERNNSHKVLY